MLSVDDLIQRINELAKKQREVGLSDEEKAEQQVLRQRYLERFRATFTNQLKNTYFVTEDGKEIPLTEINKKDGKN